MNKLLLTSFLLSLLIFSSCSKSWMEDRLEGNWKLETAGRTNFLNWKTINTGYEDGQFVFRNDGTALYTGNQLSMNGDWLIRKVRDTYNNDSGNQDQKIRMAFSVHLVDFNQQKTLNLEFDKMHYRGRNRFLAEYESSGYRYRYEFVRY